VLDIVQESTLTDRPRGITVNEAGDVVKVGLDCNVLIH